MRRRGSITSGRRSRRRHLCRAHPPAIWARELNPSWFKTLQKSEARAIAPTSSAGIDRQHDIAGLLLGFHIPGRLDHILQRIAPVDDRPISAGLDETLQEEHVLLRVVRWYREQHFLVSDQRGPQRQEEILEPVSGQVLAAPL